MPTKTITSDAPYVLRGTSRVRALSTGVAGATLPIASGFPNVLAIFPLFGEQSMQLIKGLQALANPTRLRILELLEDPGAFEGPRGKDGVAKGVTAKALLRKLRITQPSLSEQMDKLIHVGLVESTKVGRWVVYSRDEERIRQLRQTIMDQLLPG
jgi:ArsR family transcriptional regulator